MHASLLLILYIIYDNGLCCPISLAYPQKVLIVRPEIYFPSVGEKYTIIYVCAYVMRLCKDYNLDAIKDRTCMYFSLY